MITQKICSTCQQTKPVSEFYKHRSRKDGYCNECQTCCKKRYSPQKRAKMHQLRRQKILNDPEKRKNHALKSLLRGAKARAKKKQLPFNLTFDWAKEKIGTNCPILGSEFKFISSTHESTSASIDRIDNQKGYTKENCIFVSYKANTIKSSATVGELTKVANFYQNLNVRE